MCDREKGGNCMREMKYSGHSWLGIIPKNWEVRRVKTLVESMSKGNGITKDEIIPNGDTPCVRYGEIYSKYENGFESCLSATNSILVPSPQYFGKGDLLCAVTGELVEEIGKSIVYFGEQQCLAGGDIVVIRHHQDPLFLNFALNCHCYQAQKSCNKTKLKVVHISASEIGNVIMAIPPIQEQSRISKFLTQKCSDITNIIEKSKASIEEYKKLKQAIITKAVTKGVRGDRPMKESRIEWIGSYPGDWRLTKIKWLLSERNERSEDGMQEPLSMSQKHGLIPTKEMDTIPNMASTFVGAKITHIGDLVFNKLKAHLGVFAVSKYYGLVSPDYAVYYKTDCAHIRYLEYLFKTPQYILEFKKRSSGVGAGLTRLYTSDLFSMYTASPTIEEQKEIADYLDAKCTEIDNLIASKEKFITELESYKKSLIYEYVTGKKEVI